MSGISRERLDHLRAMRAAPCGCELCERAGIYEHDAGMSRATAERLAAGEVLPSQLAALEADMAEMARGRR